jgi:hypothetical protein
MPLLLFDVLITPVGSKYGEFISMVVSPIDPTPPHTTASLLSHSALDGFGEQMIDDCIQWIMANWGGFTSCGARASTCTDIIL